MRYPGRERVNAIRSRLAQLRADTDLALAEVVDLRRELDEIRRELAALSVRYGEDIARLTAAVEQQQRPESGEVLG